MKPYQFKSLIIENIRKGKLQPGESIGIATELAERYQTPLITVNRVMADLAREGVLERVRRKGTFVSNSHDSLPKVSFNIGLCLTALAKYTHQAFYSAYGVLASHAIEILKEEHHQVTELAWSDLNKPDFDRYLRLDALLYIGSLDDNLIRNLTSKKFPIVQVLHTSPAFHPFHQVLPDLSAGFYEAARLLAERKISKINIISRNNHSHCDRAEFFHRAALWAGFSNDMIKLTKLPEIAGDYGQLSGHKYGCEVLGKFKKDEAFFCTGDFLALGMLNAFIDKGLEPGKDFRLVSFDNLEAEGMILFDRPLLTSVDFPKRRIIEEAIALVEHEIRKPGNVPVLKYCPAQLIVRETFK